MKSIKYMWLIQLVFLVALLTGYVKNIIKLSDCDFEAPYKAEVIHAAGLFPPVGVFTGYMNFGE